MVCTFFGHRQVHKIIEPILRSTLIDLIEHHEVNLFYIGNHGDFDALVLKVLKDLSARYPITCYVVLAYMPGKRGDAEQRNDPDTILPEGIETVPKRFAITFRNKWMIRQSDYVVTYVVNPIGSGAAQFKLFAEKQRKRIIELADAMPVCWKGTNQ